MAAISGKPSPFVGREKEQQQLQRLLDRCVANRQPHFVLIEGDFGVGKTALARRFLARTKAERPGILIGQGKCAMESESSGLVPFSQVLISLAEQSDRQFADPGRLLTFIKEIAPGWLDIVTAGIASAAIKTVEEGTKLFRFNAIPQTNIFVQYTNALRKLAEKEPVVAFIDDLHWADESSLQLLFHIARNLEDVPFLLICSYRPVSAMETGRHTELFDEIQAELRRLGATKVQLHEGLEVAAYLAERYPNNLFPPDLASLVGEQTGGHALYVTELFSLWEDTGVLEQRPGKDNQMWWCVRDGASLSFIIPGSVEAVLERRLRVLTNELRELLIIAAVEGEEFTVQTVLCVSRVEIDEGCRRLEQLDRRYRFIQEFVTDGLSQDSSRSDVDWYRFLHPFFREYIYQNELNKQRRRLLHKEVGNCIQTTFGNEPEYAGALASHFRAGGEPLTAAKYALQAARYEQARYAWAEGERWCEFGLTLVAPSQQTREASELRLDLLQQSGAGLMEIAERTTARARFQEALAMAIQIDTGPERIAALHAEVGDASEYLGQLSESIDHYTRAREILEQNGVRQDELYFGIEADYAFLLDRRGQTEEAIRVLTNLREEITSLPVSITLQAILASIHNYLGIAYGNLGKYREAAEAYRGAIRYIEKTYLRHRASAYWLNLADNYLWLREFEQCAQAIEEGRRVAQMVGDQDDVAYADALTGARLLALGQLEEAVNALMKAIESSERIQAAWNMPYMFADLARAHLLLGNEDLAYQSARKAVDCAHETKARIETGYALHALAQTEAANGRIKEAETHFSKAIDLLYEAGYQHFAARAQYDFGEWLLSRSEEERARDLLSMASGSFGELGMDYEKKRVDGLLNKGQSNET